MKRSVLGSQSKNKPDEKKEGEGIDERANVECFRHRGRCAVWTKWNVIGMEEEGKN